MVGVFLVSLQPPPTKGPETKACRFVFFSMPFLKQGQTPFSPGSSATSGSIGRTGLRNCETVFGSAEPDQVRGASFGGDGEA